MPKRRKSLPIDKCRICLCDNGVLSDIFASELRGRINELAASTSIDINDNAKLPRHICHVCLYKLDMWCDFKAQFLKSNEILMKHLEDSQVSDHGETPAKRRQTESKSSREGSNEQNYQLKSTAKSPSPIYIASSPEKIQENSQSQQSDSRAASASPHKIILDSTSESQSQHKATTSNRSRHWSGRRTSEQRLASTQRWEARKKALLAATGEQDSDTDSMASSDNQLSPIQKARAKNNAEKEAERQRRINSAANNLGNLFEGQLKPSDSNISIKTEKHEDFKPHSVQSELTIGDSAYVVTSTLLLSDPQATNDQPQPNHQLNDESPGDTQGNDIMDAVQLKRVKPQNDKKFIERCLNIEVEGTELEALQKVQNQLAKFVEVEVKQKLMSNLPVEEKSEQKLDASQTLEQKLKTIVEKTIKSNLENSRLKRVPISKIMMNNRGTFSSAFIKAATKSSVFQPKVVLRRLQDIQERALHSPKHLDNQQVNQNSLDPVQKKPPGPRGPKSAHTPNILRNTRVEPVTIEKTQNSMKTIKAEVSPSSTHICGFCGMSFPSKDQVEVHYNARHRTSNTPILQVKQKLMRCKRCHEIVEAHQVKNHICSVGKYTCDLCPAAFKAPYFLERHKTLHQELERKEVTLPSTDIDVTLTPLEVADPLENPSAQCICFICDKDFVDDEALKEHLQQHCEEASEDEKIIKEERELYQCAICGETLDSESGLESHVEKHLFDDEDDNNPSLVKIEGLIAVKSEEPFSCTQCALGFDSELGLVMHLQQHEEDAAFAEWERQGIVLQEVYVCTICDEEFDSQGLLNEHLNMHNNCSHTCELCDRPFWTLDDLRDHINVHCMINRPG